MKIIPVILSGGGGTRLWPMSTPDMPKQFLALTDSRTMFQLTLDRCRDTQYFSAPIIVAGQAHAGIVDAQLQEMGIDEAQIILEPCARNTAPAIALAALAAADTQVAILIMPSDHVIKDVAAFHAAIMAALPVVEQGYLATFGIAPTAPETGYGYIQMGEAITDAVRTVKRFVEKPDAVRANEMIADGQHVWNGGIFLFRADSYLSALAVNAPEILSAAQTAMSGAVHQGQHILPDASAFAASPSDSIDYAVMEKSDQICVAPVAMGWSDVGSWDALYDLGIAGAQDHISEIEGKNNLIRSDGIRIHTVGVEDMIIVASGNDILILPRGQSQDVKKAVAAQIAKEKK